MPSKKKSETIVEKEPVVVNKKDLLTEDEINELTPDEVTEVEAPEVKIEEDKKEEKPKKENKKEDKKIEPKFKIGDIVYISKDADADLNGFKLFPQYKKYTYTVEAYDASGDIYSLRRLNLSLRLKGELLVAPGERAHDALNKKQF